MSKTILVKGKTGSGKSTLFFRLKKELNINEVNVYISNETHKKYYYYNNDNHNYLLGKYEEGRRFCGLDTYSKKSVAVDIIEKIISEDPNAVIYCEGTFVKKYDYDVKMYLRVSDEVLLNNLKLRSETNNSNKKKKLNSLADEDSLNKTLQSWNSFESLQLRNGFIPYDNNTDEERETNFQRLLSYANK